jgi:hypothetical protein
MIRVFLLCLTLCSSALADVTVPAETRGQPGRILTVTAETEGKRVEWYVLDPGLDLLPISDKAAVVAAPSPGKYRVLCWSAVGENPTKAVVCTVVIGDDVIPPPKPVPPDTGSFADRVKAAYGNDKSPAKAESLKKLIALYEVAQGAVSRADTLADLRADLKVASDALVPAGSLTEVRRLIGNEVAQVLGSDPTMRIDEPTKAKAVELFRRIALVLQGVA